MKLAIGLLVLALISTCAAFDVSPENPGPGEKIIIKGTTDPNKDVRMRTSFQMDLPVTNGKYEYETTVQIPQKPNRITMTARNIKDLNAGVKMIIWITKRFEATNGAATLSQADVPPGRYTLKMFGEALPDASAVQIKVEAETEVVSDSKGTYSLAIDTSGIPNGDYNIEVEGDSKTIRIGPPAPSSTSAKSKEVEDKKADEKDAGDAATSSSKTSPSEVDITNPDVIRWYAGKIDLNPDDSEQYKKAEKNLKNRVKDDYWRVISRGDPLTETPGNCEDEYCLVREG